MNGEITAFGSIFVAFGCELNYISEEAKLMISAPPKRMDKLVDAAVADINLFEDTKNYSDGAAALALAKTIDGETNPLSQKVKENVLSGLGIKRDGQFIYQVLSLAKNNRSWHLSEKPSICTYFGDICVTRGVSPNPERKGRRSFRKPEDYHRQMANDKIAREQLVTPALQEIFEGIPEESFTSGKELVAIDKINLKLISQLPLEQRLQILAELSQSVE